MEESNKLQESPEYLNSTLIRYFFPFIFFLLGIYLFNLRILGNRLEFMPGDLGDSRFINFLLEHGYQFLLGHTPSFWNAGFMYPYRPVIALSDNMLGTLPVYSLFRITGFDTQTAYQLWWIAISALNYWSCFIVLRKWRGNPVLACCGAFIFAFGLFNLSQLNYMQMACRFMVPPVLFATFKLFTDPKLKYLLVYCLGILAQFYCVIYTGFLLFYTSLLFLGVLAVFNRSFSFLSYYLHRKRIVYSLGLVLVTSIGLIAFMAPYLISARDTGFRLYKDVVPNLPTLRSYFFAHEASISWHFLSGHGKTVFQDWWLQDIFPGMLLFTGFIAGGAAILKSINGVKKVDPLIPITFASCLILFLLFTRFGSRLTLYGLIFKLPGMNSLRVLTRFMHVQLFFLILLGIVSFDSLVRKPQIRAICMILLPVLVVLDTCFDPGAVPRTEKSRQISRVEKMKQRIQSQNAHPYKALAYIPDGHEPVFMTQLDMMLAAQELHLITVNGYSSSCPPAFGEFFLNQNESGLNSWLQKMHTNNRDILIIRE